MYNVQFSKEVQISANFSFPCLVWSIFTTQASEKSKHTSCCESAAALTVIYLKLKLNFIKRPSVPTVLPVKGINFNKQTIIFGIFSYYKDDFLNLCYKYYFFAIITI